LKVMRSFGKFAFRTKEFFSSKDFIHKKRVHLEARDILKYEELIRRKEFVKKERVYSERRSTL
jgi:hypothetical protein